MKNLLLIFSLFALSGSFFACSPEEPEEKPDPLKDYTLIDQAEKDGYSVSFYSKGEFYTGYNALYFLIKKGSETLSETELAVTPLMEMTMHSHSAPAEPISGTADDLGLHKAHVIFQMPSVNGSWFIKTNLKADGNEMAFDFPVEVKQPEFTNVHVKKGSDDMQYIITLAEPSSPNVGDNPLDIIVYQMADMMTFNPVEDVMLRFEPTMPSMGHGSEGNVQPEHSVNGHYTGNVVFSMTGDWRITYTIKRADAVILEDSYFDLYFQ